MASAESPEGVIHRFASLLDAAGVPYMLTGSFASGFHGEWAKLARSNRQIEDAAGIVRIQGDKLDTSYVDRWVEQLDLRDEWQKAQTLAGQLSVAEDEAKPRR